SNMKLQSNGVLVMEGHFLVPSLNESGTHIARDQRYALTATEIDEWRDLVREERAKILDIDGVAMNRFANKHFKPRSSADQK
ncbi:MAG: hypothetical protein AAF986_03575, partial [Pseudomonadota bacterium]